MPVPALLWLNTGVLVASSVALHRAQVAARRGQMGGVRDALLAGGVLALAFLAGQLLAWRQLDAAGYLLASNPANSFFYLLTAVHGLHVLGGLVALARATAKVWRGLDVHQVRLSVELCAIYWHFPSVWLVLRAAAALLEGRGADDTAGIGADSGSSRPPRGLARDLLADWSSDHQRAFKNVSWGKAMMWIFLLSDTFVFSCFLLSYMTVRMSTTVPWPNPSEVFALTIGGTSIPLILIAIMTFVLISSSGTMAMAVNFLATAATACVVQSSSC